MGLAKWTTVGIVAILIATCGYLVYDDQNRGGWQTNWQVSPGGTSYRDLTLLDDSIIFMSSGDSTIYSIDTDGTVLWEFRKGSMGPISVSEEGWSYFVTQNGSHRDDLNALGPDGELHWILSLYGGIGEPIMSQDMIVMTHETLDWNGTTEIIAVDHDGNILWEIGMGSDLGSPVIARNGTVVAFSSDGHIHGILDGSIDWSIQVESDVDSILPLQDGFCYSTSGDGSSYPSLICIDAGGDRRWSYPEHDMEDALISEPRNGPNGHILGLFTIAAPGEEDTLFSLDQEGNVVWAHQEERLWGVRTSGEEVLAMSGDGPIKLNPDGEIIWRIDVEGRGAPAEADGEVYFLVEDGVRSVSPSVISTEMALAIFLPLILIVLTIYLMAQRHRKGRAQ
jgi:outer membrane protein assembly factor BamB